MSVTFSGRASQYDDFVNFHAIVDSKRPVLCTITKEALEERYNYYGEDLVIGYRANNTQIHQLAKSLILENPSANSVLITSRIP